MNILCYHMKMIEVSPDEAYVRLMAIVTAGGWARSGKGTSMEALELDLAGLDKKVRRIDQGLKFRAMARAAIESDEPFDSPTTLGQFVGSEAAGISALAILDEAVAMTPEDRKEFLYDENISKASGKIGALPNIHPIVVNLLRSEVAEAAEDKTDIILIDGRAMDKYARRFEEEGLGRFVVGWHFKCDPAIAARRSLKIFDEFGDLAQDDKNRLLAETLNISDRNRSDSLRPVDPLRDPKVSHFLDFSVYKVSELDPMTPYRHGHEALHYGMVSVDTSYTNSIDQMTQPVVEVTKFALLHTGELSHADVGIKVVSGR